MHERDRGAILEMQDHDRVRRGADRHAHALVAAQRERAAGVTLPRSTMSRPVSGSGSGTGGSATGTAAVTETRAARARSSYRGGSPEGTGSQARNAPFGRTGTSAPSITSCAAPVPVEPKMKFESRTVSRWLGEGYTTRRFSGPSTLAKIAGSAMAVTGATAVAAAARGAAGARRRGCDSCGSRRGDGRGRRRPGTGGQEWNQDGAETEARVGIRDNHIGACDWPLPERRSIFAPLRPK